MLEMHKHSRAANNSPFGEAASLSPPWIAGGGRNEWANESGSAVEKFSKRIATGEGGSWYGSAAALSLRILRREVKAKSFRETRRGIESPFPSAPLGSARLSSVTLREFFFAGPEETNTTGDKFPRHPRKLAVWDFGNRICYWKPLRRIENRIIQLFIVLYYIHSVIN